MRKLSKCLGVATAFVISVALGAAAQSVWPGSGGITETFPQSGDMCMGVSGWVPCFRSSAPVVGSSGSSGVVGIYAPNGSGDITLVNLNRPNVPPNALYHQVVDRYYDAYGQEVETRSASHVIGYDCHSGRRQQDLIVEDDGKGGAPRFVALLMGNEPTEGQKAVTPEDKVKVILAANKGHANDVVAPASVPGSVTLAANR